MRFFARSVGRQILAPIVGLALLMVALAIGTFVSARAWSDQARAVQEAQQRSLYAAEMNADVYSVVMDTRGLIIAKTPRDTRKFADGMTHALAAMKARLDVWEALVPPEQRDGFAKLRQAVDSFIAFRTEVVKAGLTEGPQQVDALSNNDANRANRQALNKALMAVSAANRQAGELAAAGLETMRMRFTWLLLAVALASAAVATLFAVRLVRRSIIRPLAGVTAAMAAIGEGRLDIEVPDTARQDEIGAIAHGAAQVRQALRRKAELEAAAEAEARAREARASTLTEAAARLDRDLGTAMGALQEATGSVDAAARRLGELSRTMGETGTTVAAATEQTSGNVQTVAAAAEELAASVGEIGRQAAESSDIASRAVAEATRTTEAVEGLAQSAERIGSVVRLIGDIAGQTNLLALNATIEAARAGEAGRGFAVVAGEVKSLAGQTAKATEEIASQVGAIGSATDNVVATIRRIGTTIEQMHGIAVAIAAAVEEQGAATREIARTVAEAAGSTGAISERIGAVGDAGRLAEGESDGLLAAAVQLKEQTGTVRSVFERFLAETRAA